jgi:hypothetical protein
MFEGSLKVGRPKRPTYPLFAADADPALFRQMRAIIMPKWSKSVQPGRRSCAPSLSIFCPIATRSSDYGAYARTRHPQQILYPMRTVRRCDPRFPASQSSKPLGRIHAAVTDYGRIISEGISGYDVN